MSLLLLFVMFAAVVVVVVVVVFVVVVVVVVVVGIVNCGGVLLLFVVHFVAATAVPLVVVEAFWHTRLDRFRCRCSWCGLVQRALKRRPSGARGKAARRSATGAGERDALHPLSKKHAKQIPPVSSQFFRAFHAPSM